MEIQSAYPRLQLPLSSSTSSSAKATSLRQGDFLDVVVEGRLNGQNFLLKVLTSGQSLTAESPIDLIPGSRLRLEVTQTGEAGAIPKLRIVETESSGAGEMTVTRDAERQYLPKQESVLNLTRTLASGGHQALPAPVRAAIQQMLAMVPERAILTTAEGLQRAVRHSGIFLEAKLAQASDLKTLNQDTKAQLLKLAALLDAAGAGKSEPVSLPLQTLMAPSSRKALAGGNPAASQFPDIPALLDGETDVDQATAMRVRVEADTPDSRMARPQTPHDTTTTVPSSHEQGQGKDHTLQQEASLPTHNKLLAENPETMSLPPDLDQLARKVEGALARVVMDQLASLPHPDEPARILQLAIPFHEGPHQDAAQLVITREPAHHESNQERQEDYWAIDLELHPPGLGRFCGRLVWNRGKLETYLWSDEATTTDRIAAHTDVLEARYRQAGLESSHLATLRSGFRKPQKKQRAEASSPLLDIRI